MRDRPCDLLTDFTLYQLACKGLAPSRVLCTFVPMFMPGTHSGFAKVAVQCSAVRQLAEVNQTLVLHINPDSYQDGKNRHLCQAAKRCASCYGDSVNLELTSKKLTLTTK